MGHEEQGGRRMRAPSEQQSAKDMPAQLALKERKPGQGTEDELAKRDFRAELEAKERRHFKLDKLEDFERALTQFLALYGSCLFQSSRDGGSACRHGIGHLVAINDVQISACVT
jgi:Cwf15/Cwc15 cell cycle control protein